MLRLWVTNDQENIYFLIETRPGTVYNTHPIALDLDRDPSTGCPWTPAGLGVDAAVFMFDPPILPAAVSFWYPTGPTSCQGPNVAREPEIQYAPDGVWHELSVPLYVLQALAGRDDLGAIDIGSFFEDLRGTYRFGRSTSQVGPADLFGYPVGEGECQEHPLSAYRVEWDMATTGYPDHTGEDWNRGSGSADRDDPVCAIGAGRVVVSQDFGGAWGSVIVIEHVLPGGAKRWSQYAHLGTRLVSGGAVRRGQQIGTIGDANGYYTGRDHLHLEVRRLPLGSVGPTAWPYRSDAYLDPSDIGGSLTSSVDHPLRGFIESH